MMTDWQEPLTSAEAIDRLAVETGRDSEVASAMVRDYLDDITARIGFSVHHWGLDARDVDEIRRGYEWDDYERGETVAQARERAAGYADGWAEYAATVDREHSPGYASRADQQAALWTERARDLVRPVDTEFAQAREAVHAAAAPDLLSAPPVDDTAQDGDGDGWSR